MKLERFDKKRKYKIYVLSGVLLFLGFISGIVLTRTFASFKETKTFNVIEGTGDVYVAAYIDGVHTSGDFPDKLNYRFDYAECNNNALIEFEQGIWKATVSNVGTDKTKCNIYFKTRDQANLISNKIKYFAESDTTNLAYDGTVDDSNLRYIGKNPNNYVTFNGELWRIIGTFKDIDNGSGTTEWRTKIIRNASIGDKEWHTSDENEWTLASLNTELNGSYLNGLSTVAQGMIGTTKWDINKAAYGITAANYYNQERGGAKWTGKIGLMYPSDYGYAIGGGSRATCLNYTMNTWNNHSECTGNDWLFNSAYQWTITGYSSYINYVLGVSDYGSVYDDYASNTKGVRPVVYLSSNVSLIGGSGTSADPYQLSL